MNQLNRKKIKLLEKLASAQSDRHYDYILNATPEILDSVEFSAAILEVEALGEVHEWLHTQLKTGSKKRKKK